MAVEYVAYNEDWNMVTGTLDVDSMERAQETLLASNLVVISLKKQRKWPTTAELMPTLFGVKPLDIITFTRELAYLLESGIALLPALRVLHEQSGKRALKDAILLIMREIQNGNSFSEACAKQPSIFSASYTRLLQVAEETGELKQILLEIVSYMEKQRATMGKVRKALTYPGFVACVGLVAAFILITVALPSMIGLLTEYQAEMPLTTKILIVLSDIGQNYGLYIFGGIVALLLIGWRYIHTTRGKRRWDSILLKTPVISKIINNSQMARLCSSLTTLLSGGLPTTEALYHSIEATNNTVFRDGLSEVYREVLTGSRLAPALSKQKVFPRPFSQTVAVGEATGNLKVNLGGLAAFYEQETDRVVARATDLVEPTVIIFVGLIVGFVGMSIISAIYSIIPAIG